MFSRIRIMLAKRRESQRNAKMSRAEFETMKLAKFRNLARHVQQHSPYYAEIIKARGIDVETCVPQDFPILTKALLMANFDRIVTDRRISKEKVAEFLTRSVDPNEYMFGEYHVLHTSGSSGEVGYFLYSEADWVSGLSGMRHQQSAPRPRRPGRFARRFGRFRMSYFAAVGGHFAGVSMVSSAMRGLARAFVKVQLLEVNSPLPQVIDALNRFQPDVLGGYTTALKILAEKQNQGVLRLAPMGLATGGEAMTAADKTMLEAAFKCPAYNGYGTTEHLGMGGGNPDGETMTLYDDNLIYEIFEDHSLITNLFNFTQPLIRYRMSDILRPVAQTNPTSPYLVIKSLIGRSEKVPTFLNRDGTEDFISPHTINEIFVAGIARFQLQLVSKTRFVFKVVLEASLDEAQRAEAIAGTERRLREILDQKQMSNVTFDVVPTFDLPVNSRTGKFQLIVDAPAVVSST